MSDMDPTIKRIYFDDTSTCMYCLSNAVDHFNILVYNWRHKKDIMTCDVGNPCAVIGQPQTCGGDQSVNGIYSSTHTQQ